MITKNYLNCTIRFIEVNEEFWAVAGDVAKALGYKVTPNLLRLISKDDVGNHIVNGTSNKKKSRKKQNIKIINESGIYEAILNSRRKEAKEFKVWIKEVLKKMRQSSGLQSFESFKLLDKTIQKNAMDYLNKKIKNISAEDFIKANTIANKAVSSLYGYPKMIRKDEMSDNMLQQRQEILIDTVELISITRKFNLDISISKEIYSKYMNKWEVA